jgi:hypothetical protein
MALNEGWLASAVRIRQILDQADATLARVRSAVQATRGFTFDETDTELCGLALDVARFADQCEAAVVRLVETNPSARLGLDPRYVVDDSWIDALGEDAVLELVCPRAESNALLRAGGWRGFDRSSVWQRDRDRALRRVAQGADVAAGVV